MTCLSHIGAISTHKWAEVESLVLVDGQIGTGNDEPRSRSPSVIGYTCLARTPTWLTCSVIMTVGHGGDSERHPRPYIGLPGYGHCHHLAGTKMSSLDYSIFAAPDFNPNEYASSILSSEPGSDSKSNSKSSAHLKGFGQDSVTKDDISVAISKLSFGIEDVSKQIRHLVLILLLFQFIPLTRKLRLQLTMKNC